LAANNETKEEGSAENILFVVGKRVIDVLYVFDKSRLPTEKCPICLNRQYRAFLFYPVKLLSLIIMINME
jgi:hypothetical protein